MESMFGSDETLLNLKTIILNQHITQQITEDSQRITTYPGAVCLEFPSAIPVNLLIAQQFCPPLTPK